MSKEKRTRQNLKSLSFDAPIKLYNATGIQTANKSQEHNIKPTARKRLGHKILFM